jgi:hypothetical protein
MNDPDRDKFYSQPSAPPDDDDAEYELEPLDPTIASAEERRAKEVAEYVKTSINIDDIYREAERNRGTEILEDWARNFKFRFQVKHLLIATAVLAVMLTLSNLGLFWPALVGLIMLSVAGLYAYIKWEETRHQREADRKLKELYANRRRQLQAKGIGTDDGQPIASSDESEEPAAGDVNDIWQQAPREPFRFQFSLKTLVIAMTAAAITLGVIRILGGPSPTATILGFIAVAGLIVHALGYEPPQPVILGWWLILVLYVVLSLLGGMGLGWV